MPVSLDPEIHLGLVIHQALPYRERGQAVTDSDAYGDGALMLVQALGRADITRPEEIPAYLARSIQGGIWNGRRRQFIGRDAAQRRRVVPFTDLEDGSTHRGDWGHSLADPRDGDPGVEVRDLAGWLLRHLTGRERRLVERVIMHGWLAREAGAAEDPPITHQRVTQIVALARRKLQRAARRLTSGAGESGA